MFGQARLNELRARRELLITQADLHRQLMRLEAQNAAAALSWLQPILRMWKSVKPVAWMAAPLGGLFLARRGGSLFRWGLRGLDAWRWIRRLLPI